VRESGAKARDLNKSGQSCPRIKIPQDAGAAIFLLPTASSRSSTGHNIPRTQNTYRLLKGCLDTLAHTKARTHRHRRVGWLTKAHSRKAPRQNRHSSTSNLSLSLSSSLYIDIRARACIHLGWPLPFFFFPFFPCLLFFFFFFLFSAISFFLIVVRERVRKRRHTSELRSPPRGSERTTLRLALYADSRIFLFLAFSLQGVRPICSCISSLFSLPLPRIAFSLPSAEQTTPRPVAAIMDNQFKILTAQGKKTRERERE
jgi:hypothetical protein